MISCKYISFDACDVTLSVYPHRASLKNMPDHGGNRTYDLWNTSPMLCQLSYAWSGIFFKLARCGYTLRVTSQASYSPEYITPTQKKSGYFICARFCKFQKLFDKIKAKKLLKEGTDVNEGKFVLNINVLLAL